MEKTAEKPEYITWKREYDTGIVMVDRQHRVLVELINNLEEAYNQKEEKEILRETIIKLVDYTKFHFKFEENHMIQFGYRKIVGHQKLHRNFTDQVVAILEHLKKDDFENLTEDILTFLKKWLIDHILKQDKAYGYFYKMKRRYVA